MEAALTREALLLHRMAQRLAGPFRGSFCTFSGISNLLVSSLRGKTSCFGSALFHSYLIFV